MSDLALVLAVAVAGAAVVAAAALVAGAWALTAWWERGAALGALDLDAGDLALRCEVWRAEVGTPEEER